MEETTLPLKKVQKVIGLETVSSTQDLALELARRGEEDGTLILACEQTTARRQDGSRFHAPEGGVYFTLLLRPGKNDLCAASLNSVAAESIAEVISSAFGMKTKTDAVHAVLVWNTKKRKWQQVAAVLTETFEEKAPFVLAGMGVNVNNRVSASRKEKEISVKQLIGETVSKELFLEEILLSFWKYYARWLHLSR